MPRFVHGSSSVAIIGNTKRSRDGSFHLSERQAKMAAASDEGFIVPDMTPATRKTDGYRCSDCGFGTWFTTCSRCGGSCIKEK